MSENKDTVNYKEQLEELKKTADTEMKVKTNIIPNESLKLLINNSVKISQIGLNFNSSISNSVIAEQLRIPKIGLNLCPPISNDLIMGQIKIAQMSLDFAKNITPGLERISEIANSMHPFMELYSDMFSSLKPVLDMMSKIDLFSMVYYLEHRQEWLAKELLLELKEKNPEDYSKILDSISNQQFDIILAEIYKNKILLRRSKIIDKIVDRLKNEDYISAIPLLLSTNEGICWEFEQQCGHVENKFGSRVKIKELNNESLQNCEKGIKKSQEYSSVLNLPVIIDNPNRETLETIYSSSSRHPILHGREINYDNKELAIVLLLIMTLLSKYMLDKNGDILAS